MPPLPPPTVKIFPDSSFYIRVLRANGNPFERLLASKGEHEFLTCGMVVMEVCRGIVNPKLLSAMSAKFSVMNNVPTTTHIWESATQLAWSLDRQGIVLPAPDLIIAASALHADATVLTHDAHFRSVPGLSVIDTLA